MFLSNTSARVLFEKLDKIKPEQRWLAPETHQVTTMLLASVVMLVVILALGVGFAFLLRRFSNLCRKRNPTNGGESPVEAQASDEPAPSTSKLPNKSVTIYSKTGY